MSPAPQPADLYRLPCEMCGGELRIHGVDFKQTVGCPHCGEQVPLKYEHSERIHEPTLSTNVIYPEKVDEPEPLIGDCSKHRYLAAIADNVLACVTAVVLAVQLEPFGSVVQGVSSVVFYFLYFLVFEGFFGRTPGKYLFSLRVVSLDGSRASWWQIAHRTFWRFLEANPILIGALPAAILIFVSRSHRRLGDFAAKTLVVYEGI